MTKSLKSLVSKINNKRYKAAYALFIILIVSIIPRIWKLDKYPPTVVDEPANIRDINLMLKNGISLTTFHWDFSKSQIVHLPAFLLIKLGVNNEFLALRYASVIISLASLIPFFFIAKYLSNFIAAFSSTLLFSFSYYFLQFSRVGWTDVISGVFLGLLLFWILIEAKKNKLEKTKLPAFSGVISGLIFYGYRSGIIIILTAFLCILPKEIKSLKKSIIRTSVFILFFVLTSYPWIKTVYQNKDKYNLRLRVVSIKNTEVSHHNLSDDGDILKHQIKQTVSGWVFINSTNLSGTEAPRYLPQGFQIVNWFVKIGFWIGTFLGLLKIKKTYPLFIIIFMGLYGQVITVNPPNGARGIIMLPCIYLFFALFLDRIFKERTKNKYIPALIVLLSIVYSVSDFLFYQYWMSWIKV